LVILREEYTHVLFQMVSKMELFHYAIPELFMRKRYYEQFT
jgi:hypothetical protein